jgi:hypothetical protein
MFSYSFPLFALQGFATLNQKIKQEIYECSLLLGEGVFNSFLEAEGPGIYVLKKYSDRKPHKNPLI